MSFQERVYSVLIVSASEKINTALEEMLPPYRYDYIRKAASVNAAQRMFSEQSYDMVLVNSPLPDDTGLRFAADVCETEGTVALVLVSSGIFSDVNDKLSRQGVFVEQKPLSRSALESDLRWMISARERVRKLEKKTRTIEEKMEEIRLVNRAKWILIRDLNMDEPDAHRYIEKQAMDRCVTRREVAEGIIRTYS